MKAMLVFSTFALITISAGNQDIKEISRKEIYDTEKAFEKMAAEEGIAEAFYHFADENAVIHRDTMIKGKAAIRNFYSDERFKNASVTWTPDFIEVSDDGTLGYTYGNYIWKIQQENGEMKEFRGIFHTVWKKQKDGNWRYVWD
jgi:ketosteroid isomerase-like protein